MQPEYIRAKIIVNMYNNACQDESFRILLTQKKWVISALISVDYYRQVCCQHIYSLVLQKKKEEYNPFYFTISRSGSARVAVLSFTRSLENEQEKIIEI